MTLEPFKLWCSAEETGTFTGLKKMVNQYTVVLLVKKRQFRFLFCVCYCVWMVYSCFWQNCILGWNFPLSLLPKSNICRWSSLLVLSAWIPGPSLFVFILWWVMIEAFSKAGHSRCSNPCTDFSLASVTSREEVCALYCAASLVSFIYLLTFLAGLTELHSLTRITFCCFWSAVVCCGSPEEASVRLWVWVREW